MQKTTTELVQKLANFSPVKSASDKSACAAIPEDPSVKGTKTEVNADTSTPPGPEGSGEAAKLPEVGAGDPAGSEKVPAGDSGGEVPAAKPFVENGKLANNFNLGGLRDKLAAIGDKEAAKAPKTPALPESAAVPETPAAPVTPTDTPEIPDVIKDDKAASAAAPATAPFSYHVVFNAMLKSASGREVIQDAIAEIHGVEKAASLVKQSLAEQEAYEVESIRANMERIDQEKMAYFIQEEENRQHAVLDDMLKSASSDEERNDIVTSYQLVKKAEHSLIDNPALHASFCFGVQLAEKVAAAMAADPAMMEDPGAIPEMGGPEGQPGPEEILAALEQLVMDGTLTEEQAMQLAEQLLGGGDMGGGEMPPEGDPNAPKMASASADPRDIHLEKVAEYVSAIVPDEEEPAKA